MNSEWLHALYGGILIGISASLMLIWNGRATGISSIIYGLINLEKGNLAWRVSFLIGLLCGGLVLNFYEPKVFNGALEIGDGLVITAGLLVGFGTILGSGCTSGHGVCGISRLSFRSIVATCIFVGVGMVSVFFFKRLGVLP